MGDGEGEGRSLSTRWSVVEVALFTRRYPQIPTEACFVEATFQLPPFFPRATIARIINKKKSYASRLAPRSPSGGANDDESPES